jgi:hypothetical protein
VSDELVDAVAEAKRMPAGPAKIAALELLVRKAQQQNRPAVEFRALFTLYNAGNEIGSAERKLAAYTALRALTETQPHFKDTVLDVGAHLVSSIASFPEISLAQIWALLDELEAAHVAAGRGLYMLREARVSIRLQVGQLSAAAELYEELAELPADGEFCRPCRLNQRVWFLQRMKRDAEAIELAEPLTTERETCDSTPWGTWGTLLLSHRRRGEWDVARDYFERGYRKISAKPHHVSTAAELIAFAAHADEATKGMKLLARVLPNTALSSKSTLADTYAAAAALLDAWGRPTAPLPLGDEPGPHPTPVLRAHFADRAREIGALFDRRNGNTFVSDELADAIGRA